MYRDPINPSKQKYRSLQKEVYELKAELARLKKNYQDAICNIDVENVTESFIQSVVKQVKKDISFVDAFGKTRFEVEVDADNGGYVTISVNGNQIGYVADDSDIFYATGTWDFSKATKLE